MFHDRAKIWVQGGAGGAGAVSFRREAHVPKGGPDGGDGGRGADVVLVCDGSLRDLHAFRHGSHFKGRRGGHGEGANRHGASPEALEVPVPPGTVAEEAEHGARWDLTEPGQRAVVARGGQGGRGNKHFAHSTRQAPRFAERGLPGEEWWLELRLKLMADAGLVGLPNAGKSSLLARLTRAAPKVADYPFTTVEPVLGVLDTGERQLVLADIPGLIEGASAGAGLGHEFLAHVERCRLLVHVLELAPLDGSDSGREPPHRRGRAARARRRARGAAAGSSASRRPTSFPPRTPRPPRASGERGLGRSRRWWSPRPRPGPGCPIWPLRWPSTSPRRPRRRRPGPLTHKVYRPGGDGFRVERAGAGAFRVVGEGIERLLARHDTGNEEALRYVEERLRALGVIRALEAAGFEPGDDVEIGGVVFELDPGAPFR